MDIGCFDSAQILSTFQSTPPLVAASVVANGVSSGGLNLPESIPRVYSPHPASLPGAASDW